MEEGILAIWGEVIARANFKPSADFLGDIRQAIKPMIAPLMAEIVTTNRTLPKLKTLRERIRRKDGKPNSIFHIHLDKTIAAAEDHIKECERKIAVHEKQIKYLDDFEFKWDQAADPYQGSGLFGSLTPPPALVPGESYRQRRSGW